MGFFRSDFATSVELAALDDRSDVLDMFPIAIAYDVISDFLIVEGRSTACSAAL